jgi:histidinol-phosphate aminotransferase
MNIEALARPEIVAMRPYSSARKEAPGLGTLLNANEAPWSLLGEAGWEGQLNRYPEPQPERLVAGMAQLYGVPESHVLVTRGSDEGIDLLTRVFCRAGQDAILHCPPTFGMYRIAAQTQGAAVVSVTRDSGGSFRLDERRLRETLDNDGRIRLVFLTSPNNPTGDVIEPRVLENLLGQCRDRALVVMDEAYAEFCSRPSAAALLPSHDNLVVLRTLSKAWAAAGLRCGAVLAQPPVIDLLRRVIAPYPLPSPVIALALRMLQADVLGRQREMLRQIADNKQRLLDVVTSRPFVHQVIAGHANFVLLKVERADDLLSFCARRSVILRGFPSEPLLRGYIRISVGSAADIETLAAAFDEWENQA